MLESVRFIWPCYYRFDFSWGVWVPSESSVGPLFINQTTKRDSKAWCSQDDLRHIYKLNSFVSHKIHKFPSNIKIPMKWQHRKMVHTCSWISVSKHANSQIFKICHLHSSCMSTSCRDSGYLAWYLHMVLVDLELNGKWESMYVYSSESFSLSTFSAHSELSRNWAMDK